MIISLFIGHIPHKMTMYYTNNRSHGEVIGTQVTKVVIDHRINPCMLNWEISCFENSEDADQLTSESESTLFSTCLLTVQHLGCWNHLEKLAEMFLNTFHPKHILLKLKTKKLLRKIKSKNLTAGV